MKTLKVIVFSIICGLINIRNVNACCCTTIPQNYCMGDCPFDCNFFGCNCGTIDGYCVHYKKCAYGGFGTRCERPHFMATKSSEHCELGFLNLPMLDYDSDGLISRQEIMKYLVNRNVSENTYESNMTFQNQKSKMLMTFRTKFNDIDENKDGYISSHELDNVNRYT